MKKQNYHREVILEEPYYYLDVHFPLRNDWQKKTQMLEKLVFKFGGENSGAGTDGNMRDVGFIFRDFKKAKKFYCYLKKKKIVSKYDLTFWYPELKPEDIKF